MERVGDLERMPCEVLDCSLAHLGCSIGALDANAVCEAPRWIVTGMLLVGQDARSLQCV